MPQVPRYIRIGCPRSLLNPDEMTDELIANIEKEFPEQQAPFWKARFVYCAHLIAIQYYLVDNMINAKIWGGKALELLDDYFFGEWRDTIASGNYRDAPPDRAWWDVHASWQSKFETAMLWASAMGQWERLKCFASYPTMNIIRDAEQSHENRAWLLTVGVTLYGNGLQGCSDLGATIVEGRRKRERLLFNFLTSITDSSGSKVQEAADEYFTYYKLAESRKTDLTKKISVDGSFLVHYARHRGHQITLLDNVRDHIVMFDEYFES